MATCKRCGTKGDTWNGVCLHCAPDAATEAKAIELERELCRVRDEVKRTALVVQAQSLYAMACAAHGEQWNTETLSANFSDYPRRLDGLIAFQAELEKEKGE